MWVGFDNNLDLDLEGAHSAAPIWAEFMKRALQYREYRDTKQFESPAGIVSIMIDPESGMPANSSCPTKRAEVYIAGTEPVGSCPLHRGRTVTNVAGWDTGSPAQPSPAPADALAGASGAADGSEAPPPSAPRRAQGGSVRRAPQAPPPQPPPPAKDEKKGFWRRLMGVFK